MTTCARIHSILGMAAMMLLLTACVPILQSSPTVITPVPVTPIAPPEGIRGSFHIDPRSMVLMEQPPMPSGISYPQQNPGFCNAHSFDEPVDAYAFDVDSFRASVYLDICGWREEGAPVDVTVTFPDGSQRGEVIIAERRPSRVNPNRQVNAAFFMETPSPLQEGPYQFEFEGAGANGEMVMFSAEIIIQRPTEPRIYALPTGFAYLYGFAPDETLQVLRYDVSDRGFVEWEGGGGITETYSLTDMQTVTVPADGAIALPNFVATDPDPYGSGTQIVAIGTVSGEISTQFRPRVEQSVQLDQ